MCLHIAPVVSYIKSLFFNSPSSSSSVISKVSPRDKEELVEIARLSERLDACLVRISVLEKREVILTAEVKALKKVDQPPFPRSEKFDTALRIFSVLPLSARHSVTAANVSQFMWEAGILHPLMDICQDISILVIFAIQCKYALAQLSKGNEGRGFYLSMLFASSVIILAKCRELLGGELPFQLTLGLHILMILTAYYMDAPIEDYIHNLSERFYLKKD